MAWANQDLLGALLTGFGNAAGDTSRLLLKKNEQKRADEQAIQKTIQEGEKAREAQLQRQEDAARQRQFLRGQQDQRLAQQEALHRSDQANAFDIAQTKSASDAQAAKIQKRLDAQATNDKNMANVDYRFSQYLTGDYKPRPGTPEEQYFQSRLQAETKKGQTAPSTLNAQDLVKEWAKLPADRTMDRNYSGPTKADYKGDPKKFYQERIDQFKSAQELLAPQSGAPGQAGQAGFSPGFDMALGDLAKKLSDQGKLEGDHAKYNALNYRISQAAQQQEQQSSGTQDTIPNPGGPPIDRRALAHQGIQVGDPIDIGPILDPLRPMKEAMQTNLVIHSLIQKFDAGTISPEEQALLDQLTGVTGGGQ